MSTGTLCNKISPWDEPETVRDEPETVTLDKCEIDKTLLSTTFARCSHLLNSASREYFPILEFERPSSIQRHKNPINLSDFWTLKNSEGIYASTAPKYKNEEAYSFIRKLIVEEKIDEARSKLVEFYKQGVISPELAKLREALALPQARSLKGKKIGNMTKLGVWIKKFSPKYSGKWAAIKNGEYLDSDSSRLELHKRLKTKNLVSGTTFIWID